MRWFADDDEIGGGRGPLSPLYVCCVASPLDADGDAAAAVPTWLDFLTLVTSETVLGVIHREIPTY